MKLKTLLLIKAAVCLVLGVSILAVPEFVYSILGASLAASGAFAAREYAASMLGNLMLTWFARDAERSDARWAIVVALCIYDTIGVIITVFAILDGTLNHLAWLIVALYLFFAIGFGYFALRKN
jgi:hypothetical protein